MFWDRGIVWSCSYPCPLLETGSFFVPKNRTWWEGKEQSQDEWVTVSLESCAPNNAAQGACFNWGLQPCPHQCEFKSCIWGQWTFHPMDLCIKLWRGSFLLKERGRTSSAAHHWSCTGHVPTGGRASQHFLAWFLDPMFSGTEVIFKSCEISVIQIKILWSLLSE